MCWYFWKVTDEPFFFVWAYSIQQSTPHALGSRVTVTPYLFPKNKTFFFFGAYSSCWQLVEITVSVLDTKLFTCYDEDTKSVWCLSRDLCFVRFFTTKEQISLGCILNPTLESQAFDWFLQWKMNSLNLTLGSLLCHLCHYLILLSASSPWRKEFQNKKSAVHHV